MAKKSCLLSIFIFYLDKVKKDENLQIKVLENVDFVLTLFTNNPQTYFMINGMSANFLKKEHF